MSHTVIGIFEYTSEAQEAKSYLLANGFGSENIDINTGATADSYTAGTDVTDRASDANEGAGDKIGNFFRNLFGDEDESSQTHIEAAHRGTTVTVHARSEQEALQAVQILDNYGAVDVNEYNDKLRSGSSGATGSIPVIEEELQVGKREVETGGVRLRSRIVERPVEESVRLREEHVNIERTPVDRPATEADFSNFKEGTIEVTEYAERPVVAKDARVVEEVSLDKEVTEREETVSDTVRHTEVDTEDLSANRNNYIDNDLRNNPNSGRY